MSGKLRIQTEALYAYRDGSQQVAGHLEQLSEVIEQARVSHDCFGPIGYMLARGYFNSLQECRDSASKASRFMNDTGEAVAECAQSYTETDEAESGKIAKIDLSAMRAGGSGPGGLSDVNSAGADEARGEMEQIAGYGSSWASASQSLARASDPPSIAIATVNARSEQLNALTSPGQAFVDNGLGFLISIVISPLVELILEPAVGDPAQMRSTGKGWAEVADWVDRLAEHEGERAQATEPVWEGQAAAAFREQMDEFVSGAKALATDIRGMKESLDLAADLFDAFVEMCIDIIQELVIGLIVEWLAALAASWITAGASVGAASGMTAAQVAITGTRLGSKVANLFHKLRPIVTKLEDLLQSLRKGPLNELVEKMNTSATGT
ncbi:WXG100 family type VII secretion target [Actinopolyspora sp. H202]|uniref:WXG100 family type VII secretion target n=1 Tax=Actinopolyspora sp. H202 TaxID=1500456 RepID=UPI003EE5751C